MRIIKIVFGIMILFMGLQFFSMGMMMYNDVKSEVDEAFKIVAVIDNIYDEQVFVSYNVNGVEYSSELNAYDSNFYNGQEIEIYYDGDNPENIAYADFSEFTFLLIFPVIGGIMIVISLFSIAVDIRKINIYNSIHKKGESIEAFYKRTVKNGFLTYVIECEWNGLDGKTYIFKSGKLLWNPSPVIMKYDIKEIPVKISKKNMNHYYVDTSRIAQLAAAENMEIKSENAEFVDEIKRLNGDVSFKIDPEMTYGFRNDNDDGAIKYK